jgi:cell division GTPase FtsZ
MKEKISFVAVGQAAGNIGRLLERKGYAVLYVNTSREDLDTLEDAKFKYHIPHGEGCNKDRRKAKQLVIDDFDNIAAEIESKVRADMVFVIFASGGGTGSGAGPMLIDLLIDEGKTVGAITILPARGESVKSHINSYECFLELTQISGTGACFVIDNEKGNKLELNNNFVNALVAFLEIPERHKSVKGNVDKAEVMETLRAHGMAAVVRSKGKESAELIQAARNGAMAATESDRAVKYITVSLAGNVKMADLEKAFGTPIDNFQTFNDEETVCCVSGLSYPTSRLEEIYRKVEENKELVKRNLAATREAGLKGGVNFLEEMEEPRKEKAEAKPKSKRDIMSKYL